MSQSTDTIEEDFFKELRTIANANPKAKIFVKCQKHDISVGICSTCLINGQIAPYVHTDFNLLNNHYQTEHLRELKTAAKAGNFSDFSQIRLVSSDITRTNHTCYICRMDARANYAQEIARIEARNRYEQARVHLEKTKLTSEVMSELSRMRL